MAQVAIFPIDGLDEFSMLEKSVINGVSLKLLEPILFTRLYELLTNIHGNDRLAIWGISGGLRSSEANKWNNVLENDVAFFAMENRLIGFAIVKAKFQSENVAQEIWSEFQTDQIRQYLFTLDQYYVINDEKKNSVDTICRKGKFLFDSLQIIDNQYSLELLKVVGLGENTYIFPAPNQGLSLTASEKKVVELHAVKVAIEYLTNLGYTEIEDVGDTESFDLRARSSEKQLNIEVKGSTGAAKSVILTKNEVNFHKVAFPLNGLFILSNIELSIGESISAQGGEIRFISPWLIEESNLKAISYEYQI